MYDFSDYMIADTPPIRCVVLRVVGDRMVVRAFFPPSTTIVAFTPEAQSCIRSKNQHGHWPGEFVCLVPVSDDKITRLGDVFVLSWVAAQHGRHVVGVFTDFEQAWREYTQFYKLYPHSTLYTLGMLGCNSPPSLECIELNGDLSTRKYDPLCDLNPDDYMDPCDDHFFVDPK